MASLHDHTMAAIHGGGDPAKTRAIVDFREQVKAWRAQGHGTLPPSSDKYVGVNAAARRKAWTDAGYLSAAGWTGKAWDVWRATKLPDPDVFERIGRTAAGVVEDLQGVVNKVPFVKEGADWFGDRLDDVGISKAQRQDTVSLAVGFASGGIGGIFASEYVQAKGDVGKAATGTVRAVNTGFSQVGGIKEAQQDAAAIGDAVDGGPGRLGELGGAKLRDFGTGKATIPAIPDFGKGSVPPLGTSRPPTDGSKVPNATGGADPSRLIDAQRDRAARDAAVAALPELTFWRWLGAGGPLRLLSDLVKGGR